MALDLSEFCFCLMLLLNKWTEFDQTLLHCICIYIDKIKDGIVTCHFLKICSRVIMALYLSEFCFCSKSGEQVDRIS